MKDGFISKIGVYGQMHYRYLKENKPSVVNVMRMKGTLRRYLEEVNADAENMLGRLETEMAKSVYLRDALIEQVFEFGRGRRVEFSLQSHREGGAFFFCRQIQCCFIIPPVN